MTLVLTCGHASSRHEAAHALLVRAGLAPIAAPAASVAADAPAGWAEAHTPGRLEALAAAQPELRFVLVYASPQAVLARALQVEAAGQGRVDEVLAGWLAVHDELLRFANRHPECCVLVDAACVQHAPQDFVAHVADAFGLRLDAASASIANATHATESVAGALAQALMQGRRDVVALLLELDSQATLDPAFLGVAQREQAQAWQQFAELLADRQAQGQKAEELAAQLVAAARSAAEQIRQAELAAERDRQQAQMDRQHASQEAACKLTEEADRAAAARQESELLLAQLHQVQEELEATFLKGKEVAKARDALQAQHQAAVAAHAQQASQWQTEIQTLQDKLAQSSRLAEERSAALVELRTERDQLAAEVKQHKAQADALKLDGDQLRAQLRQQPDPLPLQAQLAEVSQENELLLLQLHQVQEELEHHYLQHRNLASHVEAQAPLLRFLQMQWRAAQPEEIVIDLRREVPGENWHEAESDGRWAGPASASRLRWPALQPGAYNVALDVVDSMHADILYGTELHLNGQRIDTELLFDGFPALLLGNVTLPESADGWWQLELRFPRVMSPSERGEADKRQLALRVRTVRLTRLGAA